MSEPPVQEGPATEGAQAQIDEIRKQVHHGLVAMAVAGTLFLAAVVLFLVTADKERQTRIETVSGVIELFCDINNEQDSTLASLVDVSASGASFGAGVDPAKLTDFDREVIASLYLMGGDVPSLDELNAEAKEK
jgi:hypothetical protein